MTLSFKVMQLTMTIRFIDSFGREVKNPGGLQQPPWLVTLVKMNSLAVRRVNAWEIFKNGAYLYQHMSIILYVSIRELCTISLSLMH